MVLDMDLFRADKGGEPEKIRANQRKRHARVEDVDRIIEADGSWRKLRFNLDQLNKSKNAISKAYGAKMKAMKAAGQQQPPPPPPPQQQSGDAAGPPPPPTADPFNIDDLLKSIGEIGDQQTLDDLKSLRERVEANATAVQAAMDEVEGRRNEILKEIGNLLHPDVLDSDNEDLNPVIRTWGPVGVREDRHAHSQVDLCVMIGAVDLERGAAIAGSRGYFLTGPGVWLQQALIRLAMEFIADRGYEPIYCPFWMKRSLMGQVAQLSQFDEELYKLSSGSGRQATAAGTTTTTAAGAAAAAPTTDEDLDDKYLIATAEQPIAALHRDEWLPPASLPRRYAGVSTCFRQEVGAHGRDTRGIFRVHQFDKVEQFVLSEPAASWDRFQEMISNSEEFNQALGLPYRVVSIVSGALNNAAAMKYDLEAWFPGQEAYRELVSVSNCTDYQSRRLAVRYGQTKKMSGPVEYVHMLNGTLCAVTRTICALLEVHQTPAGIAVPAALAPHMPAKYKELIPYVNPKPKS